MNIAIITARAGSKSIVNKNVMRIGGQPLVAYPIRAAIDAASINDVYVSTDCPVVAEVARSMNCEVIDRPEHLRTDDVNHGDVIRHAVHQVRRDKPTLANVTVLLGNTVMVEAELIDRANGELEGDASIDSVMSVWPAADDHPLRAMEISDGLLSPYGGDREVSTNRQSYPAAYYYDQGVWTFRHECVDSHDGPNPWWWMGRRCRPIVRPWMTGRDIHDVLDVEAAQWWLSRQTT